MSLILVPLAAHANPHTPTPKPACPLWSDIKSEMPDTIKWKTLTRAQALFLKGIWAMNPETPPGLPKGSQAYLGTIEGKQAGMVVFAADNYQVCSVPMSAPESLQKLIDEVQDGAGDDL